MREKMNTGRFVPADRMRVGSRTCFPAGEARRSGRRRAIRLFLEAVLRRAGTGSPWRDLPEEFGKWNSVSKRFRRWARKGVFDRIFKVLSENFDLEIR